MSLSIVTGRPATFSANRPWAAAHAGLRGCGRNRLDIAPEIGGRRWQLCDLHALHFAMYSGRSAGDGVAVLACKAWLWVGEYNTLQRGTREGELLLSQPLVALTHYNMFSLYHRPVRMSGRRHMRVHLPPFLYDCSYLVVVLFVEDESLSSFLASAPRREPPAGTTELTESSPTYTSPSVLLDRHVNVGPDGEEQHQEYELHDDVGGAAGLLQGVLQAHVCLVEVVCVCVCVCARARVRACVRACVRA